MRLASNPPKIFYSSGAAQSVSAFLIPAIFLAAALSPPATSQQPPPQDDSVAQAARYARERKANSLRHPRVFTNADLANPAPEPDSSSSQLSSSSSKALEAPTRPVAGKCDNPEAQRLTGDLRSTGNELAHIQGELSRTSHVNSGDLDLQFFRPGNSGLNVGSPPLLNSEPLVPARVAQVELQQRLATLQQALRIACEPTESARTLMEIDDLEQQLNLSRRQFALDQNVYYSKTDFVQYTAEKAQLDVEQRQIQILQDRIAQLKQELAAINASQHLL